MAQVGLGQIGCGTWGQVMLTAFSGHEAARIEAVCDVNGDLARQVADRFGAEAWYDNVEDLLKHPGIDAVGVATPDYAHRDAVVAALDAGKHVLVQKPMATTVEDCKAMVDAEQRSGKSLMIDYQHRWGIGFAESRAAVQAESFGKVVHGHIRMSNSQRIPMEMLSWAGQSSVLWFLGTHTLDLLRYIIGSEVTRVYAVSRRGVLESRGVTTPDFFQSTLEFEDGACVQMENSWVLPEGEVAIIELNMELYGANECVRVNQAPFDVIQKTTKTGLEVPTGARSAVMARGKSIAYFLDCIAAGTRPNITGHDGLMNTAALVAIEKSIAEGRPVDLAEVL
jgi:predicted dehydrogenase